MQKVAYVHPKRYHFVAKDIEALKECVHVLEHEFNSTHAFALPWDLLRQFVFLLRCRRMGVRHVIAHFAGYHTVLPTLLGFRTSIIIAGSDACSFPDIRYGSFRKYWMRRAMTYSMCNAQRILPVHHSLERFSNHYSDLGPVSQGYARFIDDELPPSTEIPYGFDVDQWAFAEKPPEPKSIICVATGTEPENPVHFRKGVDLLMQAAAKLPDHRFTIVGAVDPTAYGHAPQNMRFLGRCSPAELRAQLASHMIYAQPSVMEGFPNALCEAMLVGCIPVVSDITSMPSIVQGVGEVIPHRSVINLTTAIEARTNLPFEVNVRTRTAARARILEFTVERRLNALIRALDL